MTISVALASLAQAAPANNVWTPLYTSPIRTNTILTCVSATAVPAVLNGTFSLAAVRSGHQLDTTANSRQLLAGGVVVAPVGAPFSQNLFTLGGNGDKPILGPGDTLWCFIDAASPGGVAFQAFGRTDSDDSTGGVRMGILGQVSPPNGVDTLIYQCPLEAFTTITAYYISANSGAPAVRMRLVRNGGSLTNQTYFLGQDNLNRPVYVLRGNEALQLNAGDALYGYSAPATASFNVFGIENKPTLRRVV